MEEHFNTFSQIWYDYYCQLPVTEYELDIGCKIITKIKENNYDFVKDNNTKKTLIGIISDLMRMLYYYKRKDDEYEDIDEDNYEIYNKNPLNKNSFACYQIMLYLENV
jgi:ribosomal protein S15P/S13E